MRTTISSGGQTAVPAEIRRRFRPKGDSRLEWMIEGDVIPLLPVPADPIRAFRGALAGRYSVRTLLGERRQAGRRERRSG